MKIAVFADIHGNIDALDAVLNDARAHGAEKYLFLGDYVFDMPFAQEVVSRLKGLNNAWFIKGNKEGYLDSIASGPTEAWSCEQLGVIYRTYLELAPDYVAWLRGLPEEVIIELPSGRRIYAAHDIPALHVGGPCRFNSSYHFAKALADGEFDHAAFCRELKEFYEGIPDGLCADKKVDAIAYGHSHIQSHAFSGGRLIINPGSCGAPLDALWGLPYSIISDDAQGLSVREYRVAYDVEGAIAKARDTSISRAGWIWSKLTFRTLRCRTDCIGRFFDIAHALRRARGEADGVFNDATWQAAYARFTEEYGRIYEDEI